MIDHLSPLPHVSNTRFRLAIKKYFYKDIEPEYTQQIKDLIVGDASETLDTLQELAAALDDDAEFYLTVTTRFDNLTLTVTDNELTTAAALNDLNTRTSTIEEKIPEIDETLLEKANTSSLATVATSGSYNDLSNKPTIPAEVTETTVANWGFTKNPGTYSKPSGGIPASDLSSAVLTSLGKANTAILTETDPTVPSWAKQSSKPSYTASEVGALPANTVIPDELKDLSDDATHRLVTDTEKATWNAKGSYSKPSGGIPKTDLASAVQTSLGKADTALQTETDPTVPSWAKQLTKPSYTAQEVGALPNTTVIPDITGKADKSDAIGTLTLFLDSTNYKLTLSGKKVDGTSFTVQSVLDLPLESVVVNGSYNASTKKVVLTLQNGSTVEFSIADLVAGLLSEITSTNKLSADLITNGSTNKTVTQTEKTTWNNKGTYSKPSGGIPKTDLASTVQTSLGKADTALLSFTETDPIFSASAASGITSTDISNWNAKVSNVQADWNQTVTTADDYIKNKPTIPDNSNLVHKTGDETIFQKKTIGANGEIRLQDSWNQIYNEDLDETLQQALDERNNVQVDWNQTTTTADDYIKNKPTIPDDSNLVHKTGNETIFQIKTFIHGINIANGWNRIYNEDYDETLQQALDERNNVQADWNQTTTTAADYIKNKPSIPAAPGTLSTNNTTAQTVSSSESLSGTIKLHMVAKTGNYGDLNNKPTLYSYYPETTTVPNVTSVGSASTWNFAMGTGNDEHTLIISGGNGTTPSLGTAKTVATGNLGRIGDGVAPAMVSIYTQNKLVPSHDHSGGASGN